MVIRYVHKGKESWKRNWRNGLEAHDARPIVVDGIRASCADWAPSREIRVYAMPGVRSSACIDAIQGVVDMVDGVGLDLDVRFSEAPMFIRHRVLDSVVNGRIDFKSIREESVRHRRKNQKIAEFILVRQPLSAPWGVAYTDYGLALLTLQGSHMFDSRNIYRFAQHETGHLLGYRIHHRWTEVPGYEQTMDCIMNSEGGSSLCEKCSDAIEYFWRGLEDDLRTPFLK